MLDLLGDYLTAMAGVFSYGAFLLEISMASLLLGWGVNLLMRHHSFNSRSAEFNLAILFSAVSLM